MKNRTALPFALLSVAFFVIGFFVIGFLTANANGSPWSPMAQQMEIRQSEQYDKNQFEKSKPTVGELAPDIKRKTLDGKAVQLSKYQGKNVVVIKAGYT